MLPKKSREQQEADASQMRIGWRMMGLAWMMTSETAAGLLLGWAWDKWQGTAPTGLQVGGGIGIAVGLYTLIRGAYRAVNELDRIEKRVREKSGDIRGTGLGGDGGGGVPPSAGEDPSS